MTKTVQINFFQRVPNLIAFVQGKKGFHKNTSNPYPSETWPHKEWERGFNEAYFKNLEEITS